MTANIIRSVWTYAVNGEAMGTYTKYYVYGMYATLAMIHSNTRVQVVRIDHVATDFATTGRNWDSVLTVVEDTHPEPSKTVLTPAGVETSTRPMYRGTAAYFGKSEWFQAHDRNTDACLPWQVARVDNGREIVVNGPKGLVTSVSSLADAVALIDTYR